MALRVDGGTRSATFETQSEFFRKESTKGLLMKYPKVNRYFIPIAILLVIVLFCFFYLTRLSTGHNGVPTPTRISPTVTVRSTTASPTPIRWQWYNNSRFGFTLQYLGYWQVQEEYNVDAYARRKKMMEYPEYVGIKVLRFPSDSYSIIKLEEPNIVSYEPYSVVYLNIYIYDNPNQLSLDDFFRGYQFEEGWVYPVADSLTEVRYSKMIQNAQVAQMGNIEGKRLADFEYSDMGGLYKRDYFFSLKTQIFRLDFGYYGSINVSMERTIQTVVNSFSIETTQP